MRLTSLAIATILIATPLAYASDNIIRVKAPIPQNGGVWIDAEADVGKWLRMDESKSCSAWAPDASLVYASTTVTQTSSCDYQESRSIQPMESNTKTHELRPKGASYNENQLVTEQLSRTVKGELYEQEFNLQIGQYGKSSNKYWGYMNDSFRSLYSINKTSAGALDSYDYKQWKIHAVYFAQDGSNVFVLAYSAEAPDTTPKSVTVNGKACAIKKAYYQDGALDVIHYTGCGSDMANNPGVLAKVVIR